MCQVKKFSAFLYMGRSKVWAHWNHSFDMHLSCLGSVSCIFTFWVFSGITVGSGTVWWLLDGRYFFWVSSGLRSSCWRTVFADDCNILVDWYGRTYSISHRLYKNTHFVQSLSCVWLVVTPWTAAHQASLSFTISWSLLKLMFTESVMLYNYLSLCRPLWFCLQSFPASGSFLMNQPTHQVVKVLELQLQLQHPSFNK